jgi:hypothetical protein
MPLPKVEPNGRRDGSVGGDAYERVEALLKQGRE